MSWLEAVVLGVVQGFTEFMPISSSGHLVLAPAVLGWDAPSLGFVVWVHGGSLVALLVHFRREVGRLVRAFVSSVPRLVQPARAFRDADARLAWLILLGTLPGALAGMLLHRVVEAAFTSPRTVSALLIVTGMMLLMGQWQSRGRVALAGVTPLIALGAGVGQALALLPGISRSGATIVASLVLGVRRDHAARFAFLLGIPIIAGSLLLEVHAVAIGEVAPSLGGPWLAAFVAAAVSGYVAISVVLRVVETGRLWVFALYCLVVGGVGIAGAV